VARDLSTRHGDRVDWWHCGNLLLPVDGVAGMKFLDFLYDHIVILFYGVIGIFSGAVLIYAKWYSHRYEREMKEIAKEQKQKRYSA
jgi:hypothetical protein